MQCCRSRWVIALCLVSLVGCGPKVMPRGRGASGNLQVVAAEADLGLELINRLTPEQQKAFDALHRPFDQVATPGTAPASTDEQKKLEQAKQLWDSIDFAQVKEDQYFAYGANIVTNVGELDYRLFSDMYPDQVRNFIALARSGYFNGAELRLEGPLALAGTTAEKDSYTVKCTPFNRPTMFGMLLSRIRTKGQSAGTEIGICLQKDILLENQIIVYGKDMGPGDSETLHRIHDALKTKPGSVRIEQIEIIEAPPQRLFGMEGPHLPRVDPEGNLVMPEMMSGGMEGYPQPAGAIQAADQ